MTPAKKTALVVCTILLLLAAAFFIFTHFFLESRVQSFLVEEVNQNSGGRYELAMDDLSIRLFKKNIQITGIHFNTTGLATQQTRAQAESVSLHGFRLFRLVFFKELFIDNIEVQSPEIHIQREFSEQSGRDMKTLLERARGEGNRLIQNVSIPQTEISNLSFSLAETDGETYFSVASADFSLKDITLSSDQKKAPAPPVQQADVLLNNISWASHSGLYAISTEQIEFSSDSEILEITNFQLNPVYSETQFFEQVGYRTDRLELAIPNIELAGINFHHLLVERQLFSQTLSIQQADLNIFRDKRYPQQENRDRKPLPQEMIQNLPIPVYLAEISAQNSAISYEEQEEEAAERGTIYFNDLHVSMANFTTIDSLMAEHEILEISANTKFMDASDLRVQFAIPYQQPYHDVEGTLSETDARILNPVLEPLARLRIESGNVHSVRFQMRLNDTHSIGNAEVIYDDLNIRLINRETRQENLRTRIGSFFMNTFAIRSRNPQEDPRPGRIDFEREPEKSVFNYWWKSLRGGLQDSIDG